MSSSDAKGFWFDFDGQTQKALKNLTIRKERKKPMTKKVITLNEKQKKHLLDLFNAGKDVFNDFNIKYVSAYDLHKLQDLLDDMAELYGISPIKSDTKDNSGKYYPCHYSDHVWSSDTRAWKHKR